MLQSMQITLAFTHRPTMVALPRQNIQTRLSITKKSYYKDAHVKQKKGFTGQATAETFLTQMQMFCPGPSIALQHTPNDDACPPCNCIPKKLV